MTMLKNEAGQFVRACGAPLMASPIITYRVNEEERSFRRFAYACLCDGNPAPPADWVLAEPQFFLGGYFVNREDGAVVDAPARNGLSVAIKQPSSKI